MLWNLIFTANEDHIIIMPVMFEDGKHWPPIFILPGEMHKIRTLPDGSVEFLHDYLLQDTC